MSRNQREVTMPSATQCELARVYVRNQGGQVSEESIRDDAPYDVVFEAEAGKTLWDQGGAYKLLMVLKDLSSSTTVIQQAVEGTFGDPNWPNTVLQYAFPQTPAGAGADDHVFQALGVLSAGKHDPIVDSAQSDVVIITQP